MSTQKTKPALSPQAQAEYDLIIGVGAAVRYAACAFDSDVTLAVADATRALGFDVLARAPEGRVHVTLASPIALPNVSPVRVALAFAPAKMSDSGLDFALSMGLRTACANAAISEEQTADKIKAVKDKATAIIAGTMREGGGGGARLTDHERAQRQAVGLELADTSIPKTTTKAKLEADLDKAIELISRFRAGLPGGASVVVESTVARQAIEATTAAIVAAASGDELRAKLRAAAVAKATQ
jgi:hypothetical protein